MIDKIIGFQYRKSPLHKDFIAKKNWQLAIFAYTIFAVKVLNFSVRYGKRCIHFAIVTN